MYANVQRCEKLSWKNSLSKLRLKQSKMQSHNGGADYRATFQKKLPLRRGHV